MNCDDMGKMFLLPTAVGNIIHIRFLDSKTTLIAQKNSLHITMGDDGWISVWCNGTGMGQINLDQALRLEELMSE